MAEADTHKAKSWLSGIKVPGILLITVLALAVRALTDTWTGLTPDEANGVVIAVTGSWTDMILHLKEDGNSPLLHVLLRLYSSWFGNSDLSVKCFALGISTLQVPLSYWICRRFLSREQSLQVALLLALCPPLVRWSTMVRSYGLTSILSLLTSWLCIRILGGAPGFILPLGYGVSMAALVYAHYWGGFIAIGQACLALVGALRKWFAVDALKRWLSGVAISLVLFLPWTPILLFQLRHDMSLWDVPPTPSALLLGLGSNVLVGDEYSFTGFGQFSVFYSAVLMLMVFLIPLTVRTAQFDARYWKVLTITSYAASLIVTLFVPAMRARYLTQFVPLFLILYVVAFYQLLPRLPRLASIVLPVALWLPLWIPQLAGMVGEPETSNAAIVEEITRSVNRKKDLVLITWSAVTPSITLHLPADINVISFPELNRTELVCWADMIDRVRDPKNMAQLLEKLNRVLAGGRVWMIDLYHDAQFTDFTDNTQIMNFSYMKAIVFRVDQMHSWLTVHAEQVGSNRLAPGRDCSFYLSVYKKKEGPKENAKPLDLSN